uniref:Agenet domain-containing protein n=2 Tax=Cucumis melo TaxID=3656 RepID=A0A9I9E1Y1_CUCME
MNELRCLLFCEMILARKLPFEVGQLVESRCFLIGYRGAWFRCKIKDIGWRMGSLSYELEFVDFPDEELKWTKPFQKPPAAFGIPSTGPKGQLMVRPQFPQVYREKQLSDVCTNSQLEVTVVVNDVWKVGDLVDWWKDNCYWSGKIIAILGDEEVKVELLPPPFGEGLAYRASSKDLRPSLDWSPESGWMVPNMKMNGSTQCARVINNGSVDLGAQNVSVGYEIEPPAGKSSPSLALQTSSMQPSRGLKRSLSDKASNEKHEHTESNRVNCTLENDSSFPAVKLDAATEVGGTRSDVVGCNDGQFVETTVPDVSLNSTSHGSLEDAILDLEELINRIKWIKQILDGGMGLPNDSESSWEFVEHRSSSTPK